MQSLEFEETKTNATTQSNMSKVASFTRENQILFISFIAALGFLSTGYHVSVFNSSSVFLWQGFGWGVEWTSFQNTCDTLFALSIFLVAGLFSCNKLKFKHFTKLLVVADGLMILGTLATFTIFSQQPKWIYIGRLITGESIAINLTIIPSFIKEAQFYLSESNFKTEKRRFLVEILFTFGVFLGFCPSQLLGAVSEFPEHNDDPSDDPKQYAERPDIGACIALCIIPILSSVARSVLLVYIGDVKPPQYAAAFTDEGLCEEAEEEEETSTFYMVKFKETKNLMKLFQEPYRRRIELGYLFYFLQIVSGWIMFVINPYFLARSLKDQNPENRALEDVQFTVLEFGCIYLVTNILISLGMAVIKVPRRYLMALGTIATSITAFLLGASALSGWFQDYHKYLLMLYWFALNIGLGPAMEIYAEEIIPVKGLQFLASIKWLLILVFGLIIRFTLSYPLAFIPMYFLFFFLGMMAVFLVYDLTPETAFTDPKDIGSLFEFEEDAVQEEPVHHVRFDDHPTQEIALDKDEVSRRTSVGDSSLTA